MNKTKADQELELILRGRARVLARYATKQAVKTQGGKLSHFEAKQITTASRCLLYDMAIEALITHNYEAWNGE